MGTYFTYHAESAKFALQRLRGQGVREDDLNAIDVLVVCKREQHKGVQRKVTEIFDRRAGTLPASCRCERFTELKRTFGAINKRKKFLERFRGNDGDFFNEVNRFGA